MNRRELLKMLAAGGVMTSTGLWMPGTKTISIPSIKQFHGPSMFELLGNDIKYIGPVNETATIMQFHQWLQQSMNKVLLNVATDYSVSLASGYRIINPEHLVEGTLMQDRVGEQWETGRNHREVWQSVSTLDGEDLNVDKVYTDEFDNPRERYRELDTGYKGYR